MNVLATRTPLSRMPFLFEDLGLSLISASIRNGGYPCRFLDALQHNPGPTEYVRQLCEGPENVLCVTVHAETQADEILTLLSAVKKKAPEKVIILGGHPMHAIDEAAFRVYPNAFDFVIRGDGEEGIVELLRNLKRGNPPLDFIGGLSYKKDGKLIRVANRRRNRNYGSFPRASRDTWEDKRLPRTRSALMYFSRGCNHACQFCSVVNQYGLTQRSWACRSIDDFLQELGDLRSGYGVRDFTIVDPNFLGDPQHQNVHARELASALKAAHPKIIYDIASRVDAFSEPLIQQLYDSGLRRVFIGVESGIQSVLNRWKKAVDVSKNLETAKQLVLSGIYVDTGFIMLTPSTTLSEVRRNLNFLRRLPYCTPRAIASTLWPIHDAETTNDIGRTLLVGQYNKIALSFQFAHEEVERYYALASRARHAFDEHYFRIYWEMRDRMAEDPAIIHRFGVALHEMVEIILEIAHNIVDGLERGWSFLRLENAMLKLVDQKTPFVANLAADFH